MIDTKKGNMLYIKNEETQVIVGDTPTCNFSVIGFVKRPFMERLFKLFTPVTTEYMSVKFNKEELLAISETIRELYRKEVEESDDMCFRIQKTNSAAIIPKKAHSTDVGYDLFAPFEFDLNPGETKKINFYLRISLEPGWEAQVRNRSGIVTNYKVMMPIGTGTIDSLYRGDIMCPLYNFGTYTQRFPAGSRVAQLVIKRTEDVVLKEGPVSTSTDRGTDGFGSSGLQ